MTPTDVRIGREANRDGFGWMEVDRPTWPKHVASMPVSSAKVFATWWVNDRGYTVDGTPYKAYRAHDCGDVIYVLMGPDTDAATQP